MPCLANNGGEPRQAADTVAGTPSHPAFVTCQPAAVCVFTASTFVVVACCTKQSRHGPASRGHLLPPSCCDPATPRSSCRPPPCLAGSWAAVASWAAAKGLRRRRRRQFLAPAAPSPRRKARSLSGRRRCRQTPAGVSPTLARTLAQASALGRSLRATRPTPRHCFARYATRKW